MDTKFSLTPTPEEVRGLLMARIEKSLSDNGVSLPPDVLDRIAECLPISVSALQVEVVTSSNGTHAPTVTARETATGDKRPRVYRPTPKAKPINNPVSTADRALNLIISARGRACTLRDLQQGINKPKKAIYTALWQLKRDELIETAPLASVKGR